MQIYPKSYNSLQKKNIKKISIYPKNPVPLLLYLVTNFICRFIINL